MQEYPEIIMLMGSKSDLGQLQSAIDTFKLFDTSFAARVMSAHRTPELVRTFVGEAQANGCKVIIAAAGGAAHLAGVVAAHTLLPVIGIPIESPSLKGMDSLLSTVQMPGGIPVATVGIGSAGAKNAALLALEILALNNDTLLQKLKEYRQQMQTKINADNETLQTLI